MINPARMTVFAVGIALLAHAGSLVPALAGPAAALHEDTAASATPLISPPPGETESQPQPQPMVRAYLFRGALGPIFSRGMDRLTDRLEQAGVKASVYEFTICRLIAEIAIRDYREAPAPIVLIGHSMGGLCALKFAETLEAENISVSLVVTVDPAHASPKVPLNVERFINIFLSTSILGGGDIVAVPGYRGHYASFDLKDHDEVTHINIDKMDDIHAQLVSMVTQLARVPAKADSDPIPLRYVVPPKAAVELWDSGTPFVVRPGKTQTTLSKLAMDYHVPLWSLVQANRLSENAPLAAGQRVVIPRHLLPADTTAVQTSAVGSSLATPTAMTSGSRAR
jgi:pimeloyl-ACP methyl ester carboxylesterase